jgi:hypothetical protein
MILITDSGSTKSDWIALDAQGKQLFKTRTRGMNPAILTPAELLDRLQESEELVANKKKIDQIAMNLTQ